MQRRWKDTNDSGEWRCQNVGKFYQQQIEQFNPLKRIC